MSILRHTPIETRTTDPRIPANAATFNAPMSQLDSAIVAEGARLDAIIIGSGTSDAETIDARGGYATLGAKVRGGRFDVRDYGALGTADDAATIQAAEDAAAVSGGTVLFPPGVYLSGTLTKRSKTHWLGAGYEVTILKLKNGTNADLILGQDFATLTGTNGIAGISQWSISGMALDGNKANNSAGSGLRVYAYGYTLRDVRVRNCKGAGIYSEWSTNPDSPSPAYDGMEAHVENVKVHDCDGEGITWAGPHDSNWFGVFVYAIGGHGVHVAPGGMLRATNCHVYAVGLVPWYLEAEAKLYNCIGEGANGSASNPQVMILVNDCEWRGGYVSGPDIGKVGIQIGDVSHPVSLTVIDTNVRNVSTAVVALNDVGQNDVRARVWSFTALLTWGSVSPSVNSVYDLRTDSNRGASVATPTMPASLGLIRNMTGVDVTVYIEGGTCTGVFVNGTRLTNTPTMTVRLPAYHEIDIQYTAAPTWKWVAG